MKRLENSLVWSKRTLLKFKDERGNPPDIKVLNESGCRKVLKIKLLFFRISLVRLYCLFFCLTKHIILEVSVVCIIIGVKLMKFKVFTNPRKNRVLCYVVKRSAPKYVQVNKVIIVRKLAMDPLLCEDIQAYVNEIVTRMLQQLIELVPLIIVLKINKY